MTTLRTARLVLSPPTATEVPAITSACQDPAIQEWTTIPSPYDSAHAAEFVATVAECWGVSCHWAIHFEGTLIGMIGLEDRGARAAELGFWLSPAGRGRGFIDEAVAKVCEYGFTSMHLVRIEWRAFVGNLGSAGVARRAGFSYEGLERLGSVQRGRRRDGWTGARLATDVDPRAAEATWPPTMR